ncbi:MAG: AAA family ATPase, partial [Candidatus Nanohalobium sp.]
ILATMNSYDKTSLYEMSYAFMRRFAFIRVDAPEIPENETERNQLLDHYIEAWDMTDRDISKEAEAVGDIWYNVNNAVGGRKIGPAIAKDMLAFLSEGSGPLEDRATYAVIDYVFPQLEGVRKNNQIVKEIADSEHVNEDRLKNVARDMLQVKFDGEE